MYEYLKLGVGMRSVGESKVSVYEAKGDRKVCNVLRVTHLILELPSHPGWRIYVLEYIHTGTYPVCTSGYIRLMINYLGGNNC